MLTPMLFALLLLGPFWLVFFPCVIVGHRVGVLLHEYMHGIPFRSYRHNLWVVSFYDGMLLFFGLLELFRGTHLAHHKWLNTERDPAFQSAQDKPQQGQILGLVGTFDVVQYFRYMFQALGGRHPYVRPRRIALDAALSVSWIAVWAYAGRFDMVPKLLAISLWTTLMPVYFRGAVEHHSHPDDPGFSNEYKVLIPLFNLNRHVHHHEQPRLPWYLLEFRTPAPLNTWHYFTHWFRVYVKQDYVLMRPMARGGSASGRTSDEQDRNPG